MDSNTYVYDENTLPIDHIDFSILGNDEIKNISALGKDSLGIDIPDLYDNMEPKRGGLIDTRLGTSNHHIDCATCGLNDDNCVGHFGHITLAEPAFHVGYLRFVKQILSCICLRCSKLLVYKNEDEIRNMLKNKTGKARWAEIRNIAKNVTYCQKQNYGCGTPVSKIKLDIKKASLAINLWSETKLTGVQTEEGKFDGKKTVRQMLTPEICYDILKNISDVDCMIIGIDPKKSRPEMLIHKVFPVPPVPVRPSVKAEFMASSTMEDDLTATLADVIKANVRIRKSKESTGDNVGKYGQEYAHLLQYHVARYYDNESMALPRSEQRGKSIRSVSSRLKGKEGRIRGNLMGKRVDFSARTVITPDATIDINELGIPIKISMNLTFPEVVTPYNIDNLQQLVKNGRNNYPGANYVYPISSYQSGRRGPIDLRYRKEKIELQYGDIVARHLVNGDYVLLNRQPTLHKLSMMGHRIKVIENENLSTFRLNPNVTPPYNADFDGDEMNIFIPQSIQARIELEEIADVKKQIISPRTGGPIIGAVQDNVLGSYNLTKDGMMVNWQDAMNIASYTNTNDYDIIKKNKDISGKDLFSIILPKDMNTKIGNLVIKDGQIIKGQLKKMHVGGTSNGLIHQIWDEYGNDTTAEFLNNIQQLVNNFNFYNGFTVGIGDIDVSNKLEEDINKVLEKNKLEVDHMITDMEKNPDIIDSDVFEDSIYAQLNTLSSNMSQLIMNNLKQDNNFNIMISSGSKGGPINMGQMGGCIGQQAVLGKRIDKKFNGRAMPYFHQNDDSADGRGFVASPYMRGANPVEFFFHNMGSREGLIDTAIKSVTGDTPIIIIENNKTKYVNIGNWIDGYLSKYPKGIEYHEDRDMELLKLKNKVYIPTTDLKGNVSWGKITAITRHDPGKELYEIKTVGGRHVIVTEAHSLLIWNDKSQKFERTSTPQVTIGNYVPVTMNLQEPPIINNKTNMDKFYMNKENGTFIGIFLAVGKVDRDTNLITFRNIKTNASRYIKDWFDKLDILHIETTRTSLIGKRTFKSKNINVHNESLIPLLYKYSKDISTIYNSPIEFIQGILTGFIMSSSKFKNTVYMNCKSTKMVNGMMLLLNRMGIYGKINSYNGTNYISITKSRGLIIKNDVVLDKIVSINKVSVKKYPKVYDLTIPSTLNFGLANGLHVVDTAETGYIQRKLVKAMEDAMVKYDSTVRNAKNTILQFAFGDDGIDSTRKFMLQLPILNMGNDEVVKRFGFSKTELGNLPNFSTKNSEEYLDMLMELRDTVRSAKIQLAVSDITFESKMPFPVNIVRVIKTISKRKMGSSKLEPIYIIKRLDDILDYSNTKITCMTSEDAKNKNSLKYKDEMILKTSFKLGLHQYLSPKIAIFENKLSKEQFDNICDTIIDSFNKAVVEPGEMIGTIAAQSTGEPLTQLTLNTFHLAGVGAKGTAELGVGRFRELLSLSKNLKTPRMMVYLDEKYRDNKTIADKIASHIKFTTLGDLRDKVEIYYDPNREFMQKDQVYNLFYANNPSKYSCQTDIKSLPWLARIELNKENMMDKDTSLLDIKAKFCTYWNKRYKASTKGIKKDERELIAKITQCAILSNNEASRNPIIHIRFDMNDFNFTTIVGFVDMFIDNFRLKGISGIDDIMSVSEQQRVSFDNPNKEMQTIAPENNHVIETKGINLVGIRYINGINLQKTIGNDIVMIYNKFGVEAARLGLIKELQKVLTGKAGYQHLTVLVDVMTNNGGLISIDRHGLNKQNTDPLARASFEKTVDELLNAAVFGETDHMESVSSRIMAGLVIKGGTGLCNVVVDNKLLENSEYTEDIEQKYFKTFNELGEDIVIQDIVEKEPEEDEIFIPI